MEEVYGLKDLEVWRDQPKGRVGEHYFTRHVNSCFNWLPAADCDDDEADLYQPVI